MRVSINRRTDSLKIYSTMPSITELQNNINDDHAAGISRTHILPSGIFNLTAELDIKFSQVMGQGFSTRGTIITQSPDVSIKMGDYGQLSNVRIVQDINTTSPAIYSKTDCNWVKLNDIMVTGGNENVWALNPKNPYEWRVDNIILNGNGNGILFDFSGIYNTGDSSFDNVFIKLHGSNVTGLKATGPTDKGNYINNIGFNNLYIAGQRADWASRNLVGIELINVKRFVFNKPNFEECVTGVIIVGNEGTGPATQGIEFYGGMIHEDVEIGGGVLDTLFMNTQIEGTITDLNGVATYVRCRNGGAYLDSYLPK